MNPSSSKPMENQKTDDKNEDDAVFGDESEDSTPKTHTTENKPEMTPVEKEKYDRIRSVCFDRGAFSLRVGRVRKRLRGRDRG